MKDDVVIQGTPGWQILGENALHLGVRKEISRVVVEGLSD